MLFYTVELNCRMTVEWLESSQHAFVIINDIVSKPLLVSRRNNVWRCIIHRPRSSFVNWEVLGQRWLCICSIYYVTSTSLLTGLCRVDSADPLNTREAHCGKHEFSFPNICFSVRTFNWMVLYLKLIPLQRGGTQDQCPNSKESVGQRWHILQIVNWHRIL